MLGYKMKNTLIAGAMLVSGLSAIAGQPKSNVAVVDVRSVVEGSKHFTQMQTSMQKKLGARHEELVLARKDLTKQQEELKKSKQVMATATFKKKQAEIDKNQKQLAEKEGAFQEEVMKLQDQSMKKLYALVKESTKKIAQKQGFEIVLQGEALYAAGNYDITKEVKKTVEDSKL